MEHVYANYRPEDKYKYLVTKKNTLAPIPTSPAGMLYYDRAFQGKIFCITLDKINGHLEDYRILPKIRTGAVVREIKLALGYEEAAC